MALVVGAAVVVRVKSVTNGSSRATRGLADFGNAGQDRLIQTHVPARLGLDTNAAGKQFLALAKGALLCVPDRAQGCVKSLRAAGIHDAVATGSGAANTGECCHDTGCRLGREAAVGAIASRVGCETAKGSSAYKAIFGSRRRYCGLERCPIQQCGSQTGKRSARILSGRRSQNTAALMARGSLAGGSC